MITHSPNLYKFAKKTTTLQKQTLKLRVVFMGTSNFAYFILKKILENNYNVIAIYTQPGKFNENDIFTKCAQQFGIDLFQPEKFTKEEIDRFKKLKPDIVIVASFGKILPPEILSFPGLGCLNIHASLLPKLRGPSPLQNAILLGEKETGITIILMNSEIDAGDILAQEKFSIKKEENYEDLLNKASIKGANLLLKTLPAWIKRTIEPRKQNLSEATFCQLIEREDGKIIWSEEAEKIYRKFRAFYPWPGIFTFWNNKNIIQRLKLTKISFQEKNPEIPHQIGEVFKLNDLIAVQTMKGVVILQEVNLEGKKNVSIEDFLNGYPYFVGSILK